MFEVQIQTNNTDFGSRTRTGAGTGILGSRCIINILRGRSAQRLTTRLH